MKTCSKCRKDMPKALFRRNRCTKDGLTYWCKKCIDEADKKTRRQRDARYRLKYPEETKAKSASLQKAKRDLYVANRRASYMLDSAKHIERADRRQGRLKGAKSLPPAFQAEIDGMYFFCRIFRGFEVDHIIPLNGKRISGLHVPENLQVLTTRENRSKGNRWIEHD